MNVHSWPELANQSLHDYFCLLRRGALQEKLDSTSFFVFLVMDFSTNYIASDSAPAPMAEVVTWLAQQLGVALSIASETLREPSNKYCSNQRLLSSGFRLHYPSYQAGYAAVIAQH